MNQKNIQQSGSTEAKIWLFGKTNKINKYLERLVKKKKREGTNKQH